MAPLAHRLRPQKLTEIAGQHHLVDHGRILQRLIEKNKMVSLIFYGPPGCGKTTLAQVIATELQRPYRFFNAVMGNKKDLQAIFEEASYYPGLILIMDEVHRLNKDKQDLLLPHLENGDIILLGATTSNPLFAINPAIRSRCQLLEVKYVSEEEIIEVLVRALTHEQGLNNEYSASAKLLETIAIQANGDVRYALNLLELASDLSDSSYLDETLLSSFKNIPNLHIDKEEGGHYDLLSAFQKSIRGSDVDAALLYLASLLQQGDLLSIERRLLVIAYEDIGLANAAAVARCNIACESAKKVGMPEARIIYANTVIELCLSPKSKSAEMAIDQAFQTIQQYPYQVPEYLVLTPPTMQEEDKYDYGRSDLWNHIQYLPSKLAHVQFYNPEYLSSSEQVLYQNYQKLKRNKRTSNLATLKRNKPK